MFLPHLVLMLLACFIEDRLYPGFLSIAVMKIKTKSNSEVKGYCIQMPHTVHLPAKSAGSQAGQGPGGRSLGGGTFFSS